MKIQRTRDIIDTVIAFHKNLSLFYKELKKNTERERLMILLDYMARHEKHLMKALKKYEEEASSLILDSWIQFGPDTNHPLPCGNMNIKDDMKVDDVIRMSMEFDDCIIAIFQEMTMFAENQDVREVFSNLLIMERNALKKFVLDAWRLMDM